MRPVLWCLLACALLGGCVRRAGSEPVASETRASDTRISIFTDPDTGCQYLGMYGETVTPRIAADGHTHMGCGSVQK